MASFRPLVRTNVSPIGVNPRLKWGRNLYRHNILNINIRAQVWSGCDTNGDRAHGQSQCDSHTRILLRLTKQVRVCMKSKLFEIKGNTYSGRVLFLSIGWIKIESWICRRVWIWIQYGKTLMLSSETLCPRKLRKLLDVYAYQIFCSLLWSCECLYNYAVIVHVHVIL